MGRNPTMSVNILRALRPHSAVPIQQVLRMLQSSPEFKSRGARIIIIDIIIISIIITIILIRSNTYELVYRNIYVSVTT
jgi:hypothetical protein